MTDKQYIRHTGHPGGQRFATPRELMEKDGRRVVEMAVREVLQIILNQPFNLVEADGKYDLKVNVNGGGIAGQAEAIRMAISRALVEADGENRPALKKEGFLTRDSRMVERKKYGRRKAHIKREHLAISEAKRLGIPVIAMVDTNSNPELVEHAIPANDDAYKSVSLITLAIGKAIEEGIMERKQDKEAAALQEAEEAKKAADAKKEAAAEKAAAQKAVADAKAEEAAAPVAEQAEAPAATEGEEAPKKKRTRTKKEVTAETPAEAPAESPKEEGDKA
ncbi:UNVERIFIED_CONTAM: hypothetical protein GTU68_031226 [Idotea baltica]|nr:hypothetical protein [Idotea baltica]